MDEILDKCKPSRSVSIPKYRSRLFFARGSFSIAFESERPNWFWRAMQYVLLGFVWEKLD